MSSSTVSGVPAVQTHARRGHYQTTVRVPPATEPGDYWVYLRFDNKQVAAIRTLRVVAASASAGGSTRLDRCAAIGFTVLHNDRAGSAYLPAGGYTVSSSNMDCGTASADFTSFLAGAGRPIAGWNTTWPAAGRATFTQAGAPQRRSPFSIAKTR